MRTALISTLMSVLSVPVLMSFSYAGNVTATAAGPTKVVASQTTASSILADIKQATWIRDGKSKHVIYVFTDPNCPYCNKVFNLLRPAVERGEVELRWIPIGKIMASSIGKAAAMIEDKNPTEALYRNESGFSQETGSFGGILEEPVPRDDTLRLLEANHALLKRSGHDAIPTLIFRTKDGKAEIVRGAPPAVTLEKLIKNLA